jgi:hypothetical protein
MASGEPGIGLNRPERDCILVVWIPPDQVDPKHHFFEKLDPGAAIMSSTRRRHGSCLVCANNVDPD